MRRVSLPENIVNGILNILGSLPYSQTHGIIQQIQASFQYIDDDKKNDEMEKND